MKILYRVAHALLVLILSLLLVRTVWYGFSLLWAEQHPPPPREKAAAAPRKPLPQDIAASMNTFWDMWDEDHCRNICEASWIACRLRKCDDVPGVRRPDEL
ncbi:hypothetical protein EK21DRAFT_88479 [Setomelanomma holmii]|uniref:Uncharacterized protein n=1 Tax=Setomelanomma holmii TaxID=210430 RepID=A0A9P4HA89_9PLEO|nr:hypothetical protein EK21DRAFT_88479 [Setomelanomma holmii]